MHKLDESEKKKTFFDEDYDGDYDEAHGDFHEKHDSMKGGSHKKGHHHQYHAAEDGGKKGHGQKGHHHKDEEG